MTIFGNDNSDLDSDTNLESYLQGGYFQMGSTNGIATSISVYLTFGQNTQLSCALYDSSIDFVAKTENLATHEAGWNTLTFSSSPSLIANAWYYICAWAESDEGVGLSKMAYHESTGNGKFYYNIAYDYENWPASITWGGSDVDDLVAIYCTYTESSGEATGFGETSMSPSAIGNDVYIDSTALGTNDIRINTTDV